MDKAKALLNIVLFGVGFHLLLSNIDKLVDIRS